MAQFEVRELTSETASALITNNGFYLVAQKLSLTSLEGILSLPDKQGKTLRRLDVAFNNISHLGYGQALAEALPNLRTLSAYSNRLSNVDGLRGLSRLEVLRLQHNVVPELSDSFEDMKKLVELRLDYNNISTLGSALIRCCNLETVNLSNNRLTSLDGLAGLQSLASLSLGNNLIRSLLPLRALPSLTELDVSNNKLQLLNGLENLYSLETLYAQNNAIKTLRIPQTYSRQNKTLDSATATAAAVADGSTSTSTLRKSSSAALSAEPTVLGHARLTEVFLSGNKLVSLEGLETIGTHLELLDLTANAIEADHSLSHLLKLSKLRQLKLADNPVKRDADAMKQLASLLKKKCHLLEAFDDEPSFVGITPGLGADAPVNGKPEEEGPASSDDEQDAGDGDADANKHNANYAAPTLSLRNLKTAEEIVSMESEFKELLSSCKETLFSILLKPDEPFRPPAKAVPKPKLSDAQVEASKESAEQSASLFHYSSMEAVQGFKDTVDHRGNLQRASQLTSEEPAHVVATTTLKMPFVLKVDNLLGEPTGAQQVPPLLSPSSSKGTSIKVDSGRHIVQGGEQPQLQLGSGLTLHGTKIKQKKGSTGRRQDDLILQEMLQRFVSIDSQPQQESLGRNFSRDDIDTVSVSSQASHSSQHFDSYSFLTAAPPTDEPADEPVAVITKKMTPPAFMQLGEVGEGEKRVTPAGTYRGIGIAGLDSRTGRVRMQTEPNPGLIDDAIESIRRKSSEPLLQPRVSEGVPSAGHSYDDSDDDEDDAAGTKENNRSTGRQEAQPKIVSYTKFRVPQAPL